MSETKETSKPKSFWTILSFSVADLHFSFITLALGSYMLLFYETEVFLGIWYVTLGYILYAIWNAINDPLVGFITDRPRSYWQKWGKRFPLIIMASIPFSFCLLFVFSPPLWDPISQAWFYLIWFVVSACLFDTFYSIIQTSHLAQYPELFRNDDERRKSGSVMMAMGLIGSGLGALVPGFIITFGNRGSYSTMGMVVGIIGFIFFLLYIYGHREPEEIRKEYLKKQNEVQVSFISVLKSVLQYRNFQVYLLIFFLDSIIGASLIASIGYLVKFDLEMPTATVSLLLGGFLLGGLVSIGPWLILSQRMDNNKKMLIIGVFLNSIFLLPFMFTWDLFSLLLACILLGIGGSALRVGRNPVMADVVDEAILKMGKRIEGSLMGINTFFNRLALIVQGIIFVIVHELTQFDPYVDPFDPVNPTHQTALALFGIRLHTAFIPMVLCLLGLIIFIKVYNLTPDKTKSIQEQMREIGL